MARCQKPINIRNKKTREGMLVPCGKCENCLKMRVSNWSFRLMQEDKHSLTSYFVTLTYDCNNVPITKNGFMDLSRRDFQLFFKRLRIKHDRHGVLGVPLKYYAVGEYGGRFNRPHFHIILFNAELRLLVDDKFARAVERGFIELDGASPLVNADWPKGHITVGQVSGASVGYTMKYVTKPSKIPMHRNDDRTPEFSLMSKGLGLSYLTKAMISWHKSDMEKRMYCNTEDNKKISMPRYYKNKIYTMQEAENVRAFNVLESMKGRDKKSTARERSEAFYAGISRLQNNVSHNQKL